MMLRRCRRTRYLTRAGGPLPGATQTFHRRGLAVRIPAAKCQAATDEPGVLPAVATAQAQPVPKKPAAGLFRQGWEPSVSWSTTGLRDMAGQRRRLSADGWHGQGHGEFTCAPLVRAMAEDATRQAGSGVYYRSHTRCSFSPTMMSRCWRMERHPPSPGLTDIRYR